MIEVSDAFRVNISYAIGDSELTAEGFMLGHMQFEGA